MSKYPLLFLPAPEIATKSKLGGGGARSSLPTHTRQGERLAPKLSQLQKAVNARNLEVKQTISGIDPEQVLVMEIIGSVEDFATAVRKIEGLDWLGEIEIDKIVPDQDFYDEKHPEKKLTGRLYMVMTNQTALDQMLSMWRRYMGQDDPKQKFASGLAKFRNVFQCLKDIRRWGVEDRLQETGLIEAWREDLKHDAGRHVRFEIELWYRNSDDRRREGSHVISTLIQNLGGNVLSESVHAGIAYHGILAELPANAIQEIVANPNTELVKCDSIMFIRPVGQMLAGDGLLGNETVYTDIDDQPLPVGDPVIAIFDGLPLANHGLLRDRLVVDDPDNMGSRYRANERVHGTSMASLIVQGDLNDGARSLKRPVYLRPIMEPIATDFHSPRREHIPDHVLLVDLIHRCVKRIFEGDSTEGPVASSIRVINLSIGDPNRQFVNTMSPVARMLDWLSFRYKVLFVVSAGNHPGAIHLGISRSEFESQDPLKKEASIVKALYSNARNRRLLSPAESINALTVGSIQSDSSDFMNTSYIYNPFEQKLPSPVSAFGSGYRRSIKPDIVFTGGRVPYQENLSSFGSNEYVINPAGPSIRNSPPGNKSAVPSQQLGSLEGTAYSCGTSNAAALVSRAAGVCYDSLQDILSDHTSGIDARECDAPLLKAMLVHGCAWGGVGDQIGEILRTEENNRRISELVSRWMGYGVPQIDRVLNCTEQRATLLGYGQLLSGEAHIFRFPLPPSLDSRLEWRRLTVTMAWLSPISPKTQKYRTSSLWFKVSGVMPATDRKESGKGATGWRAVRRGTVQHEVFEGRKAVSFVDGNAIEIKVNCREDAGMLDGAVPYGMAVSLEVAEGVDIAIYEEIRTQIAPTIQVR